MDNKSLDGGDGMDGRLEILGRLREKMGYAALRYGRMAEKEESWDKLYYDGCQEGMRRAAGMVDKLIEGWGLGRQDYDGGTYGKEG